MNNQDQLPMLPDPLEDQPVALPAPTETIIPTAPVVPVKPRRNYLRIGLIFGSVAVVLLLTLFGSRLIDLLNLRGTKAGTPVTISGHEFVNNDDWYEKDSQGNVHKKENGVDNRSLFIVKDVAGETPRLMLNQ